jgi:hypothetical protein
MIVRLVRAVVHSVESEDERATDLFRYPGFRGSLEWLDCRGSDGVGPALFVPEAFAEVLVG